MVHSKDCFFKGTVTSTKAGEGQTGQRGSIAAAARPLFGLNDVLTPVGTLWSHVTSPPGGLDGRVREIKGNSLSEVLNLSVLTRSSVTVFLTASSSIKPNGQGGWIRLQSAHQDCVCVG